MRLAWFDSTGPCDFHLCHALHTRRVPALVLCTFSSAAATEMPTAIGREVACVSTGVLHCSAKAAVRCRTLPVRYAAGKKRVVRGESQEKQRVAQIHNVDALPSGFGVPFGVAKLGTWADGV